MGDLPGESLGRDSLPRHPLSPVSQPSQRYLRRLTPLACRGEEFRDPTRVEFGVRCYAGERSPLRQGWF